MRKQLVILFSIVLILGSCKKDTPEVMDMPNVQLDEDMTSLMFVASDGNGLNHFLLPNSNEYDKIPQDPLNPITTEKVNLRFSY